MTKEEAKAKWCPFTRLTGVVSDLYTNREDFQQPETRNSKCLGSDCMAWRWLQAKRTAKFSDDVLQHMRETGANYNKALDAVYKKKGDTYDFTEGYCGLAGAPQ